MIVDSCLDTSTKLPVAIRYLRDELGVRIENDVRLVVATHWHDDHINGLGAVFRACPNAKFVCSAAMQSREFAAMAAYYGSRAQPGGSGVDEFKQIFEELNRRGNRRGFPAPVLASADKGIYTRAGNAPVKVRAYSPSDAAVATMLTRFERSIRPQQRRRLKVPSLGPNDCSVVLGLEIGSSTVMLGADLEERKGHQGFGWTDVLTNFKPSTANYEGFKIPHHGSETGYHPDVWPSFMRKDAWAVLTPYAQGSKPLPSVEDLRRIGQTAPQTTSVTALPHLRKFKHHDRAVQKTIAELGIAIFDEPSRQGHVRLRRATLDPDSDWTTELYGDAQTLSQAQEALAKIR